MMRELQRCLVANRLVDVIYIDRTGKLSQRRLKLLSLSDHHATAYCYSRQAIRSFAISNILAIEAYKKEA